MGLRGEQRPSGLACVLFDSPRDGAERVTALDAQRLASDLQAAVEYVFHGGAGAAAADSGPPPLVCDGCIDYDAVAQHVQRAVHAAAGLSPPAAQEEQAASESQQAGGQQEQEQASSSVDATHGSDSSAGSDQAPDEPSGLAASGSSGSEPGSPVAGARAAAAAPAAGQLEPLAGGAARGSGRLGPAEVGLVQARGTCDIAGNHITSRCAAGAHTWRSLRSWSQERSGLRRFTRPTVARRSATQPPRLRCLYPSVVVSAQLLCAHLHSHHHHPSPPLPRSSNFATVRSNACVFRGRWQYEVQLGSAGIMQLGWTTLAARFTAEEGVGDNHDRQGVGAGRGGSWGRCGGGASPALQLPLSLVEHQCSWAWHRRDGSAAQAEAWHRSGPAATPTTAAAACAGTRATTRMASTGRRATWLAAAWTWTPAPCGSTATARTWWVGAAQRGDTAGSRGRSLQEGGCLHELERSGWGVSCG